MVRSKLFTAASLFALMAAGAAYAEAPTTVSEVIVTGAPYVVSLDSTTTSVDVVSREELDTGPSGGLGDVLNGLPGVRSTFFGPGASRPVIRGLAGPRVMVLTNGVGMIDASALSPDHQVATDPQEAERIEVLRGPAALAYGGSAIGGVVNIIDDRISDQTVAALQGRFLVEHSSVDDGGSSSAAFKVGRGNWVFTLDGLHRQSEDYDIPVAAKSDRLAAIEGGPVPNNADSSVINSAVKLNAYGAGLSYVGDTGFAGVAIKQTDTTYGVPGDEPLPVTIVLKQTRIDTRGALDIDLGPFNKVKFAGGYADYTHTEFEGPDAGTKFLSDGWEGRLELVQRESDGWQGAVGVQTLLRNFDAIGEEALVPKTRITEQGIFALQRLDKDSWGVEGGLRLDRRKLDSVVGKRDFTNVSVSMGAFLRPADGVFLGLSLSRTSRAPTEEELFADGPHPATLAFEQGDIGLDQEISYSLDASLHYNGHGWKTDFHVFAVKFDGFIDLLPTGVIDTGSALDIFQFVQTDAKFYGAEGEVSYRAWQSGEHSLTLEGAADYVRADTDLGPAARIPPWSVTGRAVFEAGWWNGRIEVRHVAEQNRVAGFEVPTDGYTQLNATMTFRPISDKGFKVFIDGRNLTNVEAREHASFLKDLAPLPGRNVRVGVGYAF